MEEGKVPGVVGIKNHGNTCFINAILQCLSYTDILAEYFVLDQGCIARELLSFHKNLQKYVENLVQFEIDGITWNSQKLLNFARAPACLACTFFFQLRNISFYKLHSCS